MVNHAHNTNTNAALRLNALMIPSIEPAKYIGIKTLVAGSNTVNVNMAEAPIEWIPASHNKMQKDLICNCCEKTQ